MFFCIWIFSSFLELCECTCFNGLPALIDLIHFMFCPPRSDDDDHHDPPSTRSKVADYFSPVLPAWSWMTLTWLYLHHQSPLSVESTSNNLGCHLGQYQLISMMDPWTFLTILDQIYPRILSLLPWILNVLAMFCSHVRTGLMGCWTTKRALSLLSFPGVTLAQVGCSTVSINIDFNLLEVLCFCCLSPWFTWK